MGLTLTPWQLAWVDPDNDQDKEPDTDLNKEEIISSGSYDESGPGNRMSYEATVANLQSR